MFETEVVIHDGLEVVVRFAEELTTRYAPEGEPPTEEAVKAFRSQAPKRVVLEFRSVRALSWDHRKLGGVS